MTCTNILFFFFAWPAEAFGLPFVPPYLAGGDFRQGANFAVGGATALNGSFFRDRGVEPTWTPHSLDEQMQWFKKLLTTVSSSESGTSPSWDLEFFAVATSMSDKLIDAWAVINRVSRRQGNMWAWHHSMPVDTVNSVQTCWKPCRWAGHLLARMVVQYEQIAAFSRVAPFPVCNLQASTLFLVDL